MTDQQLNLPERHTVLCSLVGHLDADPEAVYERLAGLLAPGDETGGHFLADPARRLIVVQGDWWYRGEYRVRPDGAGSTVEHEIFNVARIAHWAGALTGRSVVRGAPAAFGRLVNQLQDELSGGTDPGV